MVMLAKDAAALEVMREEQARQWAAAAARDQRVGQRAPVAFFVPTLERLLSGRPAALRGQMRRLVAAGELTEHRTGRMVYWRFARKAAT